MIYLDTNILLFLLPERKNRLSLRAKQAIEAHELLVSPMVVLELEFLNEIGRISEPSHVVLGYLEAAINLKMDSIGFDKCVLVAQNIKWTRDPFDRLIVSCAVARNLPLLTVDRMILENCPLAFWD